MIDIEYTLNGIEELQNLLENLESFDSKPALQKLQNKYLNKIRKGFRNSEDPYGVSWDPLKHRDGQALLDTTRLLFSIRGEIKKDELGFGTGLDYALPHQEGLGHLPKRAILPDERGLPDSWALEFEQVFWDEIFEKIK